MIAAANVPFLTAASHVQDMIIAFEAGQFRMRVKCGR
jgi:hypothetical protein